MKSVISYGNPEVVYLVTFDERFAHSPIVATGFPRKESPRSEVKSQTKSKTFVSK